MATDRPPLFRTLARIRPLVDRPLLISQAFRDLGGDRAGAGRRRRPGRDGARADRRPGLPAQGAHGSRRTRSARAWRATRTAARSTPSCCARSTRTSRRRARHAACGAARSLAPRRAHCACWRSAAAVAIVGAGPAGSSARSRWLEPAEREVVVFERAERVGRTARAWRPTRPTARAGARCSTSTARARSLAASTCAWETRPAAASSTEFGDVVLRRRLRRGASPAGDAGATSASARHRARTGWPGRASWCRRRRLRLVAGRQRGRARRAGRASRTITVVTPGAAFAAGIPAESRVQLMGRLSGASLA